MLVQFNIVRQTLDQSPRLQSFRLDVEPGTTILDCLNQIKWEQDGSLAYRKNCRNTICGSCSMRINGRSALACKENVGSEVERSQLNASITDTDPNPNGVPIITVAPMGNMPVIKDLVVDMTSFWDNLEEVNPYVSTAAREVPEREFLQTPEERDRLNQVGNCILCGACYSECNAREVNPDFVGPHALAKAARLLKDSRDTNTETRVEAHNIGIQGTWGCTRCYFCNAVCPMEVAPMDQIGYIKQEILERNDAQASRAIRHRKTLIDLVKEGGWVDERKFGIQVVGNTFRDIQGLVSLGPLGLRMMAKGKFPLDFHASDGTDEVRSLIETVQRIESEED